MKSLTSLAFAAGVLFFNASAAFAAQPTCSLDSIATCAQLEAAALDAAGDKVLGFPASQTGEVIFNIVPYSNSWNTSAAPEMDKKLIAMQKASPTQRADALKLGEELRLLASEAITKNTAEKSLTAEQKAALARLSTLNVTYHQIREDRLDRDGNNRCGDEAEARMPNAFYEPLLNTIYLCPSMAKQSKAFLAYTISHELGHVIGPCTMDIGRYDFNPSKASRANLDQCDQSLVYDPEASESRSSGSDFLGKILSSNAKAVHPDASNSAIGDLEKCGVLTFDETSRQSQTAMYAKTRTCIERSTSSIYNGLTREIATKRAVENESSIEAELPNVQHEITPSCLGNSSEQFADSFGAELLGTFAQKNRWSPTQIRAALLTTRGNACSEQKFEKPFGGNADYPSAANRLITFLNNGDLADKLGCAPAPATGVCPFKIELSSEADSKKAASGARATKTSGSAN